MAKKWICSKMGSKKKYVVRYVTRILGISDVNQMQFVLIWKVIKIQLKNDWKMNSFDKQTQNNWKINSKWKSTKNE